MQQNQQNEKQSMRGFVVVLLSAALWIMAPGRGYSADFQNTPEIDAFVRKEALRISGSGGKDGEAVEAAVPAPLSASPLHSVSETPSWRVSIADIPVENLEWIPDVEAHASEAQAEVVRAEARALSLQGRHKEAIEQLEQLVGGALPERLKDKVLEDLADYSYRIADYRRSLEFMNKRLESLGEDPALVCNLAAVHMQMGHYEKALILLESIDTFAIQSPALLAAIFFNRACAYSRLNRFDKAVASLYIAFKAHPNATSLWLTDPQLDGIRGDSRLTLLENAEKRKNASPPQNLVKADMLLKGVPEKWVELRGQKLAGLSLQVW